MDNELYHHGVKGMRWGVRRYQNSDGSLTAAGRKRYGTKTNFEKVQQAKKKAVAANSPEAKAKRKADERTEKEVQKYMRKAAGKKVKDTIGKKTDDNGKYDTDPKKKLVSDMTDEELNQVVRRMQLEQQYSSLKPDKVSAGKKFVDKVLLPAAAEAGKNLLREFITKQGKELMGLNEKKTVDYVDALQKEVKKINLEKTYEKETGKKFRVK